MTIAVALGVALAASVWLVNGRMLAAIEAAIAAVVGRADLRVVGSSPVGVDDALLARIADVPGVAIAAPAINVQTFLDGDLAEPVNVWGLDLVNEGALRLYGMGRDRSVEMRDPLLFVSQTDSVMVTRAFLASKGFHLGDVVRLVTPGGVRPFVIRAVVDADAAERAQGATLLLMDVYDAQAAFSYDGRFTHVDVMLEPGVDADAAAARLSATVGSAARVEPAAKRDAGIRTMLVGINVLFCAFSMAGLALSTIVTFNRLSSVFRARQWELGVSRAIGASPAAVVSELLKEAGIVAVAGAILGVPLGALLSGAVAPRLVAAAASVAAVHPPAVDVPLRVLPMMFAATLGIGVTLLAALARSARGGSRE